MSADPLPTDAMALEDRIEQRLKDLLSLATDPKDLTAALKVATDWWKTRKECTQEDGYGANRGRGTVHHEQ